MQEWKKRIASALDGALPGEAAHQLMMNYTRETAQEVISKQKDVRMSAVLILIYPSNDGGRFLLLKRHDYAGVHSGQVGLPGGKVEAEDEDLMATAIRECHEESGVLVKRADVIGELSSIYIPPSNFLVYPFVAVVEKEPDFDFDQVEVKFPIEVPLKELLEEDNIHASSIFIPKYESKIKVKNFLFGGEIVWGATGMILMELKSLLTQNQ